MDQQTARAEGLQAAAALYAEAFGNLRRWPESTVMAETAVLNTADRFAAWITGTTKLTFRFGPVTDQTTGAPQGHIEEGSTMASMTNTQQFQVTVEATDSKGYPTVEEIDFSSSDESVFTVVPGEDQKSAMVVAGVPGSAVLTAKERDGEHVGTLAVDVTSGETFAITISAGEPTEQ